MKDLLPNKTLANYQVRTKLSTKQYITRYANKKYSMTAKGVMILKKLI